MPAAGSTLRQRVETASRPLLVRLTALPRLSVPLFTVILIVVGLFAPLPLGLAAFGVVVVFLVWVAYLAWPAVPFNGKLIRLVMVALVLGLASSRFWPT